MSYASESSIVQIMKKPKSMFSLATAAANEQIWGEQQDDKSSLRLGNTNYVAPSPRSHRHSPRRQTRE